MKRYKNTINTDLGNLLMEIGEELMTSGEFEDSSLVLSIGAIMLRKQAFDKRQKKMGCELAVKILDLVNESDMFKSISEDVEESESNKLIKQANKIINKKNAKG